MTYNYEWHRQEANFGPVIPNEVAAGTHFTIESIPMFNGKYVALRRPKAIPHHEMPPRAEAAGVPLLYFIHDLPIWGESLSHYVERIVREQAGVGVSRFRVFDLTMNAYVDSNQWALTPYLVLELDQLPVPGLYGNTVTEVVTFSLDSIPDEFGWYNKDELTGLIKTIENPK
jgi:hypothetical protein